MIMKKTIELSYGRNIYLELLDARSIKVSSNCTVISCDYLENNIININFTNQRDIKLGDTIQFKIGSEYEMNLNFKVNQIKQFDNYFILYSHKRTKSSYFLFPMLGYNREYFEWGQFFINTYSICTLYNTDKSYLFLSYKYMPVSKYTEFEKNHIELKTFVEILQPKCKDEVVFVHKLSDIYKLDIENFKLGRYSLISDITKKRILFFHSANKESELGQILYKDKKKRKQMEMEFKAYIPAELDLLDPPLNEDELLNLE